MGIQVDNSLHAAATVVGFSPPDSADITWQQGSQGCVVQRIEQDGNIGWLILLDYPLHWSSCSVEVTPFQVREQEDGQQVQSIQGPPVWGYLFHIDDRVKLLATFQASGDALTLANSSFHLSITNFQANVGELRPVELAPPLNDDGTLIINRVVGPPQ